MTTKPVDGELKYLVGLFEGEGCSCIRKYEHPESRIGYYYQAHLRVAMTDCEPIHALHDYFGGLLYTKKQDEDSNHRDSYEWVINGEKAGNIAKQLIPHILTARKRGALQCIIDFAATLTSNSRALSPEIIQKRDDLRHKCCAYNATGRSAHNRDEDAFGEIEAYKPDTAQMNIWA